MIDRSLNGRIHHRDTKNTKESTKLNNLRSIGLTSLWLSLCSWCLCGESPAQDTPRFERIVIDDDFPGGYQVEVADVNGDGKPDIIALGGGTCAWYENPTWTKRIITTPDQTPGIISSAAADLDGDGKAEIAIAHDFAMREPKRGKLALAIQGETPDDPWTLKHIADVPSIHRVRWGDITGDGRLDLVVAPIFGPEAEAPTYEDPARLVFFSTGDDPKSGQWADPIELARRPVMHAIRVDGPAVLSADNLGVGLNWHNGIQGTSGTLHPGAPGEAPDRGASEIHRGRNAGNLRGGFTATIEPWHGNQVVVYQRAADASPDGAERQALSISRTVLDDTLDDGHALWVADIDGDGNDEVFAGHRGEDYRVSMYKFDGETWQRTVLDTEIAAQDLRGGDLDGNGVPDVVAIGGKTHNVVWYRPIREGE
ncbi:VCBS repeat-containing protein [soil metagenome]